MGLVAIVRHVSAVPAVCNAPFLEEALAGSGPADITGVSQAENDAVQVVAWERSHALALQGNRNDAKAPTTDTPAKLAGANNAIPPAVGTKQQSAPGFAGVIQPVKGSWAYAVKPTGTCDQAVHFGLYQSDRMVQGDCASDEESNKRRKGGVGSLQGRL